ncbi:MAG: hypothetical protein WCX64_03125 [Candidatus Micrarchaeia archaeon]|jgi:hypothetical protein
MSNARHAQASLFDGITFLTLVMTSIAIIFVSLSGYGSMQNSVINRAHVTNYLQNSFKTIYYVDAAALSSVTCNDEPYYCNSESDCRSSGNCVMGCEELSTWTGLSVAELIKRDMRDYDQASNGTGLDDTFGLSRAPGKLAARCAFKEVFQPFSTAGYSYMVDFKKIVGSSAAQVPQAGMRITNNQQVTSCDQEMGKEKLVVNAPFKVFKCNKASPPQCEGQDFIMTACVWPTRETTASS